MTQQIYRSHKEPRRENLSFEDRWRSDDKGLILCWEIGRELAQKNPELAAKAKNGELPVLDWKGGTDKKLKKNEKYGTLNYLSQWQALRGEDLDIDSSKEYELTCSKTDMKVIYTSDIKKYCNG